MEHLSCYDILIIGGGASGLMAAICAKEENPDLKILIVDKACASKGWAGKAARTAGLLSYVAPDQDPEKFMQYCLNEIGFYLNDQFMLREFAYNSYKVVQHLRSLGIEFKEKEDGTLDEGKWPFGWTTGGIDPDMCLIFAKKAREYGVHFIDHCVISGLIKDNNRVIGACGFDIKTGKFDTYFAKETVLACGSQNFDVTPDWCSTGVSQLLAFEAGCKFRNVEFAGMGDFARVSDDGKHLFYGQHGGAHTAHDHLYANGENISQKWRPGLHSSMDPYAANAWYREANGGKTPIYANMEDFFAHAGGDYFKFHPKSLERDKRREDIAGYPQKAPMFRVVPGMISEMSCIYVDHQMRTSVPGLFAIGDTSGTGSARGGAVPAPPAKIHGTGLMNAFFMATIAGRSICECIRELDGIGYTPLKGNALSPEIKQEINQIRERTFSPMNKSGISPRTVIHRIQDAMAPCDYLFIKAEKRMQEALGIVAEAKNMLPEVGIDDYHELSKYLDARAMVLCAEMFFRASLERKESRGFHYREDYPNQDKNWLKWLILENDNGKIAFSTEEIPFSSYNYQPTN